MLAFASMTGGVGRSSLCARGNRAVAAKVVQSLTKENGHARDGGDGGGYDWNRPDPRYGNYDPGRYYRPDRRERRLARNERIYRGQDGRYYCRRPDGSTGLVIGAIGGGVLGNVIAPGGSELLGTILGAVGGGVAGRAIERSDVRCR